MGHPDQRQSRIQRPCGETFEIPNSMFLKLNWTKTAQKFPELSEILMSI